MRVASVILLLLTPVAGATELVHEFHSPAFSGQGYGPHVLAIEQMESQRRQRIRDEEKSAQDKAEREIRNSNLSKFLVNVESRIYAQLSKQLADTMFAEGGATSGELDFQGTNISWVKNGTDVTLTVIERNGNRTDITVPIAQFAF